MEEGVSERKYDKNEKIDEVKEAEFPDDTPPDDMEEGVSEKKDDKNKNMMRKKNEVEKQILRAPEWMEVKE